MKQIRNIVLLAGLGVLLIFVGVIPKGIGPAPQPFDLEYNIESTKDIITNIVTGEGLGKTERNTYYVDEATTLFFRSLKIFIPAFFVSLGVGVLLGLIHFQFRNSFIGRSIYGIHLTFSSLPDFFAFILIQYGGLLIYSHGILNLDLFGHEHWYNSFLPVMSLSLYPIFYIYRITFSTLEDESKKDYISTVRAKGKSDTYILYTHMLWNTWARVITNIRTITLYILTSLPIIELLAFYQGMGYRILKAAQEGQVYMFVALLYPFFLVMFLAMLLSDLFKHFLVPLSVESSQALRPMKAKKLGKYVRRFVVWFMTKLINGLLVLKKNPLFVFSLILILGILYTAVAGPKWSVVDTELEPFMFTKNEDGKLVVPPLEPSSDYWLGTDKLGRDLFSLIILGAKETLLIITIISLVRFMIGIPLGFFASRGNWFSTSILHVLQMMFSFFPVIILVMLVMAIPFFAHTESRIYWIVLLMAIVEVGRIGQIYREEFERIGQLEYVKAGIASGATKIRLLKNYYFPLLKKQTIIFLTNDLGRSLFLLAQLGFISVFLSQTLILTETEGYKFINTSLNWAVLLGNALNDIRGAIWIPFFVTLSIAITILAFNFLGEGLKRLFDSKPHKVTSSLVEEKITLILELTKWFTPKKVMTGAGFSLAVIVALLFFLNEKNIIFKDESVHVAAIADEERVIDNLAAFAKAYGYIRYFHPSGEGYFLDWNRFAVYGIKHVQDAGNEKQLRKKLEELFYPVAPTVQFLKPGEQSDIPVNSDVQNNADLRVAFIQHEGVGPDRDIMAMFNQREEDEPKEKPLFRSVWTTTDFKMKDQSKLIHEHLPKKDEVLEVKISEDIISYIPLTLYSEKEQSTVGMTDPSWKQLSDLYKELGTISLDKMTLEQTETYLANTIIAWNKLQHFYPYLKDREGWSKELKPAIKSALRAKNEKEFLTGINTMITVLEDGQAELIGNRGGGRYVQLPFRIKLVEGNVVVVNAHPDSPIKKGDMILEKDNTPIIDVLKEEGKLISGSTQWKVNKALTLVTTGRRGESSSFKFVRDGKEEFVKLEQDQNFEALDTYGRVETVKELENGIYYVNLVGTKMDDIKPLIPKLANAKGIVFDIRGIPDLSTKKLLSHLIKEKSRGGNYRIPQIVYPDYHNAIWFNKDVDKQWSFKPKAPTLSGKWVFLASEETIGDGESYLHFVTANKLGQVVGRQTAGANGLVNSSSLVGGATLNFTGMVVQKQDGSPAHIVGIEPNVPVILRLDEIKAGKDVYIEKALEVIKGIE
ncbi:ABC transporter permease subunit [Bacillus sp. 31A1R]|uniref:ABC transporter permease subunit n=1 Tax=Robertmurraya mangrovi TaxID=3098077 RepID=A0ABU5IVV8_9BACI|nr:ABC transporter permease subunit [Bacillus sp. 31A1R]